MINPLLMIFFAIAVYSMKNGSPAGPREFRYIVSVQRKNYHLCSGVIIDKFHVMTIAHIIDAVPPEDLRVIGGTNILLARWARKHIVKKVHVHSDFEKRHFEELGDTYYNDIALLKLKERIDDIPGFAPVLLGSAEYDWDNPLNCILISWEMPIDRRSPMILSWELMQVLRHEETQEWATFLGKHKKFFSDFFEKVAINEKDLGSPIVCENSTIGLVVQAELEAIREKPSVLMSIVPYLEFIREIVQDGLFDVEPVKYPYIVAIWSGTTHVCGGFVLDATHIATAGHCVTRNRAPNYTVGVAYPTELTQWFSIAHITFHPGYKVESTFPPVDWYIDHDFAILTLAGIISWSGGARPLTLPESDDFHEGQICEVLCWNCHRDEENRVDAIKLMSSRVVLMDECSQLLLDPSTQFQVPSFWGRSQYSMPIADSRDVGNPIICEGKPVGFLVQAVTINEELSITVAKFLKIRPYMEFSWHMLNQNE